MDGQKSELLWSLPPELEQSVPRRTARSSSYLERVVYATVLSLVPLLGITVSIIWPGLVGSRSQNIVAASYNQNIILLPYIGATFFVCLVAMLVWNHWNYIRQRRLLQIGMAVPVTILKEKEIWGGILGRRWRVSYEFEDATGRKIFGRTSRPFPTWAETERPTILYETIRPANHVWYPPAMVVCLP